MYSKELDRYYKFEALSLQSTKLLVEGDFSTSTTRRIQEELNAYCVLNPKTFAGIVYHPDGSGPEQPYMNPHGADWTPEVQAIARIGVQHEYWSLLHAALAAGTIDIAELISTEILILFPTDDGRVKVLTNSYPNFLKNVVKIAGDTTPRYPKYVPLVNYEGDADFYGPWSNSIFPMIVQTASGEHARAPQKALGIPEALVEKTWVSWGKIDEAWRNIFERAVKNSYVSLPNPLLEVFNQKLQCGEKFRSWSSVGHAIFQNKGTTQDYDLITNSITHGMHAESRSPQLLQATADHARNLADMYATAKNYRRDIYHY